MKKNLKKTYGEAILLAIVAFLFLGYGISEYTLIDLDEPRYPKSAREMIDHAQYWLPMTNGKFLYEKPILIYWTQILAMKIFGVNEFASRLPSVLAGSLTVMIAFIFGRFYKVGVFSALILATSVEFFIIARLSIPDMLLNFFTITPIVLYFLISEKLIDKKFFVLFAVLVSFGFLTKGPLGIFVPCLVIASYSLMQHLFKRNSLQDRSKTISKNLSLVGLMALIFIFLGLGWFLIAHNITAGAFTKQFFITENLQRYSSTLSGHKYYWWFYIAVIFVGFLPWSIFIPAYLIRIKENFKGNFNLKLFCFSWIIPNILFFSSSGTKLYNYIFSLFFPLAILCALWLKENFSSRKKDIFYSSIVLFLLLTVFLALYLRGDFNTLVEHEDFLHYYISGRTIFTLVDFIFLVALIGTLIRLYKSIEYYLLPVVLMLIFAFTFSVNQVIRPFADFKTGGIKRFVEKIPEDYKLYSLGIDRPSLGLYANKYTKSIGKKKLIKKLGKKEKFCILAKQDKRKILDNVQSLKLLDEDYLYIFACTDFV